MSKSAQPDFRRHELKFVVNLDVGKEILHAAAPFCDLDPHAGPQGRYEIASVYYDTEDLRFFHDRNESVAYRRKLRLRSYNRGGESEALFIELKEKHKHLVHKKRAMLPSPEFLNSYARHDKIPVESILSVLAPSTTREEIAFLHARLHLIPISMVRYVRTVLRGIFDAELRITLDQRVSGGGRCLTRYAINSEYFILPPEQAILEVKAFGSIPLWLSSILLRYEIYQERFSKYGEAIVQGAARGHFDTPSPRFEMREAIAIPSLRTCEG